MAEVFKKEGFRKPPDQRFLYHVVVLLPTIASAMYFCRVLLVSRLRRRKLMLAQNQFFKGSSNPGATYWAGAAHLVIDPSRQRT
jgi:hypothetical protein